MNDAQFKRLPRLVAACARAGWFQGTVVTAFGGGVTCISSFLNLMRLRKVLNGDCQVLISDLGWQGACFSSSLVRLAIPFLCHLSRPVDQSEPDFITFCARCLSDHELPVVTEPAVAGGSDEQVDCRAACCDSSRQRWLVC